MCGRNCRNSKVLKSVSRPFAALKRVRREKAIICSEGEDISAYLDMSKVRRPEQEHKRVKIDFPLWMIRLLDKEAKRLGVPRQSIIKVWLAERLKKAS
jgi:hypothetical protein